MKTEAETRAADPAPDLLTRPFDLASRIEAPRFRVDAIAFADIGLIALFALFLSQPFLFSPGVPIRLPVFEDPEVVVGVRSDAVATVWKGKIVTPLGSYPLDRLEAALGDLALESSVPSPTLLLLVDRGTALDELARIYESAREAGFATIQLAARGSGAPFDATGNLAP